ncbi:rhodanese-like domain-containing protein [Pelagicoccus albus]|uniref:Rhodanese-like domain-containing protein n=1 Tax=Pelagicoccus albus TaxID=415222 RepID=A0A7X1B494_9BACT|nr:rhodanese-like domain-containing protein [Pelagicoccus albus]
MLPSEDTLKRVPADYAAKTCSIIIDVRSPEAFGECRIPQAVNHCVFEVAFVDSVEAVIEDKNSEMIVYGQSDRFYAAAVAVKRLSQAGYSDVKLLEGGLEGWNESGHETFSKPESDRVQWRHFDLDTKLSRLRWIGRSLMTQHEGGAILFLRIFRIRSRGFRKVGRSSGGDGFPQVHGPGRTFFGELYGFSYRFGRFFRYREASRFQFCDRSLLFGS